MSKFYYYVDETGLDVSSPIFVVAVVVVGDDRHEIAAACQKIEKETGKHPKWKKASKEIAMAFVQRLIDDCAGKMRIYYAVQQRPENFINATADVIAQAILARFAVAGQARAVVFYDGLARSKEVEVGARIRRHGLTLEHVRGIADDHEPLIRVADAICGLIRKSYEGNVAMRALAQQAIKRGLLVDLNEA